VIVQDWRQRYGDEVVRLLVLAYDLEQWMM
jgi:hypothetical protein